MAPSWKKTTSSVAHRASPSKALIEHLAGSKEHLAGSKIADPVDDDALLHSVSHPEPCCASISFAPPGPFAEAGFRESDCHEMLIGAIHDLNPPAPPILSLVVSFCKALAGKSQRLVKSRLEIRQRGTLRVIHQGAVRSEIEVVKGGGFRAGWWGAFTP
jgi:hypothetical protein